MSLDTCSWMPIGLVQHHAEVGTDVVYTWTLEDMTRDRYEALVGRADPGTLRVTLCEIIARFEVLHMDRSDEDMTIKRVVELFIQEHFEMSASECRVALCMSCCPPYPSR